MSEGRERKLGRVKVAAESDSQRGRKGGRKARKRRKGLSNSFVSKKMPQRD